MAVRFSMPRFSCSAILCRVTEETYRCLIAEDRVLFNQIHLAVQDAAKKPTKSANSAVGRA